MRLEDAIAGVHSYVYDHREGRQQAAQTHLSQVRQELANLVPVGMRVLVSGSGQSLPVVPWIAVLNPDVTRTAQEGLYVVYLYRQDVSQVFLTMNQGVTQHKRYFKDERGYTDRAAEGAAIGELQQESNLMRKHLAPEAMAGLLTEINLGADGYFLPQAYEAGTVAGCAYDPAALPGEQSLRQDLERFLALYDSCVDIKDELRASQPGALRTTAGATAERLSPKPKPPRFRPKNSAEYTANVPAQVQVRDRRHEKVIEEFGQHVRHYGLISNTNVHPRDLTVTDGTAEWLIEAKVVKSNGEHAVRDAIGQLCAYRHFYYRNAGKAEPRLVGLFSESPGQAFIDLLDSLGIEAIWKTADGWRSSAPVASQALGSQLAH